jgi:CRP/FNR family transcriptional regulator/CRP/FNR family nitrogen fixation transcriptional regulator
MADHLGLTIHTVSRTLSQLQTAGLIEARSSRHVRLTRRDLLERIRA